MRWVPHRCLSFDLHRRADPLSGRGRHPRQAPQRPRERGLGHPCAPPPTTVHGGHGPAGVGECRAFPVVHESELLSWLGQELRSAKSLTAFTGTSSARVIAAARRRDRAAGRADRPDPGPAHFAELRTTAEKGGAAKYHESNARPETKEGAWLPSSSRVDWRRAWSGRSCLRSAADPGLLLRRLRPAVVAGCASSAGRGGRSRR